MKAEKKRNGYLTAMVPEKNLVSIIIPAYNRASYIGETILSVMAQTWARWELIIVDDGSTDETLYVVSPFLNERIRYYHLEHTGRLGIVRNAGISHARGEFIAFLDSDDLWKKEKLQTQIDLITRYPDAAFVIGNGEEFGENFIRTPDYPFFYGNLFLPVLEKAAFCFFVPTLMFKKSVIDDIGLLPDGDSTIHDIHFFFRMSWKYPGIFTNERLASIRKHKRNTSAQDDVIAYINTFPMLDEFRERNMISVATYQYLRSRTLYEMGLVYLRKHERALSMHTFLSFNLAKPFQLKGYVRWLQAFLLVFKRRIA